MAEIAIFAAGLLGGGAVVYLYYGSIRKEVREARDKLAGKLKTK